MTLKNIPSIIFAIIILTSSQVIWAKSSRLEKYYEEITELSIDDNINSPEVPKKYLDAALATMGLLAGQMEDDGLKTDLSERGGLALMVTVPVADLFASNDTILKTGADKVLEKFKKHLLVPDKYKLLIAVHSDDTGNEEYLNNLTQVRAEAILSWFSSNGIPTQGIVTYGMGYDEPLNTEETRQGRAENRRVEFYFVPGPILIEHLKTKRRK